MVTDISPIFGLTLLDLMGILTVVAGVGSLIIAGAIIVVHIRQHGLQVKIASAHLSLKMLGFWTWSVDKGFAKFADKMHAGTVKEGENGIQQYLDILEEIATFWKEGTITYNHVKEFFKPELETIPKNEPVMLFLKEKEKEGAYGNLGELLNQLQIQYR